MRSYKIKSYLPEESFYQGKDAHFWRAAFADCFVIDLHYGPRVLASCRGNNAMETSMADAAVLLGLFHGSKEFLILPSSRGTMLIYPAWPHLELALAFLLNETPEDVQKACKNAQRYAFSTIFDTDNGRENTQQTELEAKLFTLQFYMNRLFGDKRETNAAAHILMIANLVGCRLHEMSVLRVNTTLDEREMERLDAYLFCTFMTMRRYNGKVSALPQGEPEQANMQHVMQEYGLRIEQSRKERVKKPTAFDLPTLQDVAPFATHPLFADYKTEEADGVIRLHIPIKQKALLSSITARGEEKEITVVLFPLF